MKEKNENFSNRAVRQNKTFAYVRTLLPTLRGMGSLKFQNVKLMNSFKLNEQTTMRSKILFCNDVLKFNGCFLYLQRKITPSQIQAYSSIL